jgi:hypothetical protein
VGSAEHRGQDLGLECLRRGGGCRLGLVVVEVEKLGKARGTTKIKTSPT